MTAPYISNTTDPYETALAAWAKAKIAAGADPTVVNSLAQDKAHAYRASLALRPDKLDPETGGERAAGALSAAYQGMTMGAGNKITAGVRTLLPQALGGVEGFDFPEALKEQTGVLNDYRERHPVLATGMEIAGSVPTILATGGAAGVPEAKGLAKAVALAKQGAAYGAASGALSANQFSDVIPGALEGGVVGGIAGPVAGAVGSAAARGTANAARRVFPSSRAFAAIAESVGAGPVTAEEKAQGMVGNALTRGGVEPEAAAAALPVSAPTTALDLGSRPAQVLARQARNVPTSTAGQTLDTFLADRSAGAGQRIEGALTGSTGHAATDVDLPVEQMIARRSEEAKPLYEKAYGYGEIKDPETVDQIKTLLKKPVFSDAWHRGQDLVELEGGPLAKPLAAAITPEQEMYNSLRALGVPEDKALATSKFDPSSVQVQANPTVAQIDAWKKGLDAKIESSAGSSNALSRSEARAYRNKLNGILDRVDTEVSDYAAARDNFRGNSELKEAAEAGASHFSPSQSADYLKRTLPDMSDGEQEVYRANAINAAVAKIRTMAANPDLPDAARGTNIVQRVMGTEDAGKRLRMLFPDENSYNTFVQQMEQEAKYPQTNQFIRNQSSTAAQLAENQVSPGAMRDALLSPVSRMAKLRLAGRALQTIGIGRPGMQPAVADAVARQSTLTGQPLADFLKKISADKARQIAARNGLSALLGNTVASNQP